MNVYFNSDYTACDYIFDTTRKSGVIAQSLTDNPIKGVHLSDPAHCTETTEFIINRLHDRRYIKAVKTGTPIHLAESQGFTWDESIYTMAVAHNAGLVAATTELLVSGGKWAGSLSSGLHHAKEESGDGFCTFNGIAVAAQRAFDLRARNILVLDFDAHCGGGTYSMTRHLPVTQIDVSTSSFDHYVVDPDDKWSDCSFVAPEDYIQAIHRALQRATYAHRANPFDLVVYNAGMDPFNTGVSSKVLNRRESMVADWAAKAAVPTVVTLAGGYTWGDVTMEQIVDLHRMTFTNFARHYRSMN